MKIKHEIKGHSLYELTELTGVTMQELSETTGFYEQELNELFNKATVPAEDAQTIISAVKEITLCRIEELTDFYVYNVENMCNESEVLDFMDKTIINNLLYQARSVEKLIGEAEDCKGK